MGVGLFFVLSGFILAYNYWDPNGLRGSWRKFWTARFARVYPVYVVGLLFSAPFFVLGLLATRGGERALFAWGGVLNPLLLQAWTPATSAVWNTPGWSLSAEAFFYFVFPWLAVWMGRVSRSTLAVGALAAYVCSATLSVLSATTLPWLSGWVYHTPLLRLPEFVIGAALAVVFLDRRATGHLSWLGPAGIGATLVMLSLTSSWPQELYYAGLLSPFFAATVFGLGVGRGALAKLLSSRPFILLGEASYALYIFHKPLFSWMEKAAHGVGYAHTDGILFTLAYVAVSIALSIAVLLTIENPARRWIRQISAGGGARRLEPRTEPTP